MMKSISAFVSFFAWCTMGFSQQAAEEQKKKPAVGALKK
jgi:hypothetical protein